MASQILPSGSNSRSRPPFGCSGRTTGIAMSLVVPLFGSMTPTNWAPKSEYQTCPILIDEDVVGKSALARKIACREADFGGPALGARERLERIFDRLGIAEAHAREKFRGRFGGIAGDRRALPARARQQRLRMRGRAARGVTRHSQKYLL